MHELRELLVGVTLDGRDAPVLRDAEHLARAFGARARLLHAYAPAEEFGPEAAGTGERARATLAGLEADLVARGVTLAPGRVLPGRAEDLLVGAAEQPEVDLVVVGAGTRGAVGRLLLGSTVEAVLADSPRPVWVAPATPRTGGIRRILCALDPEHPSPDALETAGLFARRCRADLEVVAVGPEADPAALRAFVREAPVGRSEPVLLAREGRPDDLAAVAAERGADLLVVGPTRRRGLAGLLRRGTPERLSHRLGCPLLCAIPRPVGARTLE